MATVSEATNRLESGVDKIDALLADGPSWNYQTPLSNVLYFTFSGSGNNTGGVVKLSPFNQNQVAAVRQALTYVESVTGIDFVETTNAALADFHFSSADVLSSGASGYTWMEYSYTYTGANVITSYDASAYIYLDIYDYRQNINPSVGTDGYQVLLHEIGHALGLKHPFEGDPILPAPEDDTNHTLMSYTWLGGNKTTFQDYDLDALWWIYGGDGLGGALGVNSTYGPTLSAATPSVDITPPAVVAVSPRDEAADVAINSNILITFNEAIYPGSGAIVLRNATGTTVASYNVATSANVSISGATLTIDPSFDFSFGTEYTVAFSAGAVQDLAGNSFLGAIYNFKTTGSSWITGTMANDIISGGAGITIDGLTGIDTVTYSGGYAPITHNPNGTWTVDSDVLSNIERLHFSNKKLALDIDGNAGTVAKILASVFGAVAVYTPENVGIGLDLIDGGMTYETLSALAIKATGVHSREAVVDLLWTNLMGSHPTTEQAKPFIDMLAPDLSNVGTLGVAAADFAATIGVVDLTELRQTGLEYV